LAKKTFISSVKIPGKGRLRKEKKKVVLKDRPLRRVRRDASVGGKGAENRKEAIPGPSRGVPSTWGTGDGSPGGGRMGPRGKKEKTRRRCFEEDVPQQRKESPLGSRKNLKKGRGRSGVFSSDPAFPWGGKEEGVIPQKGIRKRSRGGRGISRHSTRGQKGREGRKREGVFSKLREKDPASSRVTAGMVLRVSQE